MQTKIVLPKEFQNLTMVGTNVAAQLCGVHPHTIRDAVHAGDIRGCYVGGRRMLVVRDDALARFVRPVGGAR